MNVKSWLRREPAPAVVVVDGARRVAMGAGPRRWQDAADTIAAMGATRLEALAADGSTLRATILDDDAPETASSAPSSGGASDLQTFAKLLSDAYLTGANATKASYELAFTENTKLVGLLASRLGALEVAWQKSMQSTASLQAALAQAGESGGESDGVFQALMAGMMNGKTAAPATTGKG